ncbi:MAG: FAD-binding oxidoreductase [Candidatus Odinarchaeota archaeon]|nr:FAD-binding oxidoreductase [Candidatus Odinarchaeota archaeon]
MELHVILRLKKELDIGLELLRRIKNALDPNNILNSGKLG